MTHVVSPRMTVTMFSMYSEINMFRIYFNYIDNKFGYHENT